MQNFSFSIMVCSVTFFLDMGVDLQAFFPGIEGNDIAFFKSQYVYEVIYR